MMTHEIDLDKTTLENDPFQKKEISPPRVGRRESEPHSSEISYIFDLLTTNFPNDRTFWDLHHYFKIDGEEDERCFDISWFKNFSLPNEQSHYKAWKHNDRVPDLVINVLSHSTWSGDLSDIVDFCRLLKIPVYIVYAPYHIATRTYKPPFLRIFQLKDDGSYEFHDCRQVAKKTDSSSIDITTLVSIGENYPFKIGLEQLAKKHENGSERYRLIFVDPVTNQQFLHSVDKKEELLHQKDQMLSQKDQMLSQKNELLSKKDEQIEQLKQELSRFKK